MAELRDRPRAEPRWVGVRLGGRYGDARDWADIDRWADRIVWALTAR